MFDEDEKEKCEGALMLREVLKKIWTLDGFD